MPKFNPPDSFQFDKPADWPEWKQVEASGSNTSSGLGLVGSRDFHCAS